MGGGQRQLLFWQRVEWVREVHACPIGGQLQGLVEKREKVNKPELERTRGRACQDRSVNVGPR